MNEVILKYGFTKRIFPIYEKNEKLLDEIMYMSGLNLENVLEMALNGRSENKRDDPEVLALRDEIEKLQKEMFILETEWSSLRYRLFTEIDECKKMAIALSGLISENRKLRKLLGMKKEPEIENIWKTVEKYLFFRASEVPLEEEEEEERNDS